MLTTCLILFSHCRYFNLNITSNRYRSLLSIAVAKDFVSSLVIKLFEKFTFQYQTYSTTAALEKQFLNRMDVY